ncbi:MAG: right-handed parallel beta-helix repeat-containing protein [Candidatus Bipolaricaulota bacterium]
MKSKPYLWLTPVLFSLLMFFVLLSIPFSAPADTLTVSVENDAEFDSIQAAIESAETGDTVFVKNGHYEENLVIDKTLLLKGEEKSKVEVSGAEKWKPVLKAGPSEISVTIESLIFENAEGKLCDDENKGVCPTGISAVGSSSLTLSGCLVKSNGRDGLAVIDSARIKAVETTLENNSRYGIWAIHKAQVEVCDSRIVDNKKGLSLSDSARMAISDTEISSNGEYGLSVFGQARIEFRDSKLTLNRQGGLRMENSSRAVIKNSSIADNKGPGVLFQSSVQALLEDSVVEGNSIGLVNHSDQSLQFRGNRIADNSVDLVGNLKGDLRERRAKPTADKVTYSPEDYSSFQSAVDSLAPGGVLVLQDEKVQGQAVIDKDLTIRSTEKSSRISSPENSATPILSLVEGADLTLIGLELRDAGGSGIVAGANSELVLVGSSVTGSSEEGIGLWNEAGLRLLNSQVQDSGGSGIRLVDSARLTAQWSKIARSQIENVLLAGSSQAEVYDSEILDSQGDGLAVYDTAVLNLSHSKITNNSNGIALRHSSALSASNNLLEGNQVGIKVFAPGDFEGQLKGEGNFFWDNGSDFDGVPDSTQEQLDYEST